MFHRPSFKYRTFSVFNHVFLILLSLLCLAPMVHVLAISFSTSTAASAGLVKLWPVDATVASYSFIFSNSQFVKSFLISIERCVLGVSISMFFTILLAYPLSKEMKDFRFRTLYAWYFMFTVLFGGGLIPWYMTIKMFSLDNSIWGLVLPGAVQVFNAVLMLNFFRGLPKELEESAFIDGASHWTTLWRILVPISMPSIATILLFAFVGQWNSWFDGLILMKSPDKYPLATYLQTIIIKPDFNKISMLQAKHMSEISDRTTKAAQIIVGSLPILLVYPFLQRFFVKGIVVGSVKE
ncbi:MULTISPECIES: carbohydrate ABC transporter permease [Paenibacillus]|uniref:Carbohydrate ABC transporter permease n=1 Tax=Paenibacillus lignilyticus TaxID=1172615 RepID=A0ABS5CJ41_9BACL|nr:MULTISPECIES: carbohydrate ABC transporter permease [Paenibacillus]MBP3965883.1 carbohydrate ABC transporter permease [Paenibacillus lignilyticus]SFT04891.1 putative aldouronate transport system permease protein [Paenibacillus sp. BC26]